MRSEKEVYDIVLSLMIFRILILLFLLRIWTASQVMING